MFVLAKLQDTVRIKPGKFMLKLNDCIIEELNETLSNKVVVNVGLCITLFDILEMGDSFVLPGDGAAYIKVIFRYVVFRPFIEEILVGKIKSSSQAGVSVSLGFFDDILIPPHSMQYPCRFDEADQVWVWEYEGEDGKHDLIMDPGEEIRFRIVDETFSDNSPTGPLLSETSESADTEKKIPYSLMGSIGEAGLGLQSWWN